jgi:hypothetical protein
VSTIIYWGADSPVRSCYASVASRWRRNACERVDDEQSRMSGLGAQLRERRRGLPRPPGHATRTS